MLSKFCKVILSVMFFCSFINVNAESLDKYEAISSVINEFYSIINDNEFELNENDEIFIGPEIPAYIYMQDKSLKLCSNQLHPVFKNDELQLFVTVSSEGNVDITQALVSSLKEYYKKGHYITLIYDRNACYVYDKDDNSLNAIFSGIQKNLSRGVLDENSMPEGPLLSGIIAPEEKIIKNLNTKSGYYAMLSVTPVLQGSYQYLCWAASAASVGNYLTGSTYSATDVCLAYYGYIGDYPIYSMDYINNALHLRYPTITYSYYSNSSASSGTYMYTNLSNNYPMFGKFQYSGGGYHCCVIRGINNNTGKLYIIDPKYGYQTVSKSSGVYSYYSSVDADTLTLKGYGAKL